MAMFIVRLIIAAFLPALCWISFAVHKKISIDFPAAAFFAACISVVGSLALQYGCERISVNMLLNQPVYLHFFFRSFITAALIEESVKISAFTLVIVFVQKRYTGQGAIMPPSCNAKTQMMIDDSANSDPTAVKKLVWTAVLFGLLFSGFENISYGIRYPQFRLLRLCTASVLHGALAFFAVQIMYTKARGQKIRYFAQAVLFHGAYNVFMTAGGVFMVFAAVVLVRVCFSPLKLLLGMPSQPE